MNIDHIVLWVDNQQRSLDFFVNVVGLDPVKGVSVKGVSVKGVSVKGVSVKRGQRKNY